MRAGKSEVKLVTSVYEAMLLRRKPVTAGGLAAAHTWEAADLEEAADCRQRQIMGQSVAFWGRLTK